MAEGAPASPPVALFTPDCAPDLVTQAPLYCADWVRPPAKISYPLDPDSGARISVRRKPLRFRGGGCRERWARERVVAFVDRCGGNLVISLKRLPAGAPKRVFVEALGAGPAA